MVEIGRQPLDRGIGDLVMIELSALYYPKRLAHIFTCYETAEA